MAFQRMFVRIANPQFDKDWISSHAYDAPAPRPEKEIAKLQSIADSKNLGSTYSIATQDDYTEYRRAAQEALKQWQGA